MVYHYLRHHHHHHHHHHNHHHHHHHHHFHNHHTIRIIIILINIIFTANITTTPLSSSHHHWHHQYHKQQQQHHYISTMIIWWQMLPLSAGTHSTPDRQQLAWGFVQMWQRIADEGTGERQKTPQEPSANIDVLTVCQQLLKRRQQTQLLINGDALWVLLQNHSHQLQPENQHR